MFKQKAETMIPSISDPMPTQTNPHARTYARILLVCTLALLAIGCDAQSSGSNPITNFIASFKKPRFVEPALRAKIVDEISKQPVEGAAVYGYYAAQQGSLGGGKGLVDVVRSFETPTDANGQFELPAWNSGDKSIDGDAISLFPMIMIYKPGYEVMHQNLKSIKEWRSVNRIEGSKVEIKDSGNLYDWTKYPHVLRPLEKAQQVGPSTGLSLELLRYWALSDSSRGMMSVGECGWENYKTLLLMQHREWKEFLKRNVPSEYLDKDGYFRGNFYHPDLNLRSVLHGKSALDNLRTKFAENQTLWKCTNPNAVFAGAKP